MTERCPYCARPVLRVAESRSTITWVHEWVREYMFGCTRSTLPKKAAA